MYIRKANCLRKIARKYGLSLILIFGSYVNGKTHNQSDLDIGVLAKFEPNFNEYSNLYSELSEVFPKRNVDLIFLNRADPLFLKKILENCQVIYGSRKTLAELKIYSFKRYCDYKRLLDLEKKFVHHFIKELK